MDRRPLTRLRIAFLLLAAALLLPLGWLLRSVDARLEAQRRLRHELVAERIFDEMEGELSALLAREDARPSAAYADTSTRVENWAPFVVGYFRRDAHGLTIVAKPQLAPERVHRLEAALRPAAGSRDGAHPGAPTLGATEEQRRAQSQSAEVAAGALDDEEAREIEAAALHDTPAATSYEGKAKSKGIGSAVPAKAYGKGVDPAALQKVQAAPEAVLKQLNRAADTRKREAPAKKVSRDDSDPLSGME